MSPNPSSPSSPHANGSPCGARACAARYAGSWSSCRRSCAHTQKESNHSVSKRRRRLPVQIRVATYPVPAALSILMTTFFAFPYSHKRARHYVSAHIHVSLSISPSISRTRMEDARERLHKQQLRFTFAMVLSKNATTPVTRPVSIGRHRDTHTLVSLDEIMDSGSYDWIKPNHSISMR